MVKLGTVWVGQLATESAVSVTNNKEKTLGCLRQANEVCHPDATPAPTPNLSQGFVLDCCIMECAVIHPLLIRFMGNLTKKAERPDSGAWFRSLRGHTTKADHGNLARSGSGE